jgi:transcriptional regulator with XRE-family HTH domain
MLPEVHAMSPDKIAIGARLRDERKRRGWDKPEMARQLADALTGPRVDHDTLVSYVKRWEPGKVRVSERYRLAYARAFGVDEEQLFRPPESSLWTPPDAAGPLTPDDEERLLLAAQRPARVDRGVIDALAAVLAGQRRLEDAIGPAALVMPVGAQMEQITAMLRDTRGPHHEPLGRIVAEWTCYVGWLYAAVRQDARALEMFGRAEELADDFEDGVVATEATSFNGYVARRRGRFRAELRASYAALGTAGTHPVQHIFNTLQAARAYASLRERERARRLVDDAAGRIDDASDPPPLGYWYTPAFFQLYTGMVLGDLGEYGDAADMLRMGIESLPAEQRGAEWMAEYRDALTVARGRA